jgi:hypothetical protein
VCNFLLAPRPAAKQFTHGNTKNAKASAPSQRRCRLRPAGPAAQPQRGRAERRHACEHWPGCGPRPAGGPQDHRRRSLRPPRRAQPSSTGAPSRSPAGPICCRPANDLERLDSISGLIQSAADWIKAPRHRAAPSRGRRRRRPCGRPSPAGATG